MGELWGLRGLRAGNELGLANGHSHAGKRNSDSPPLW